MRDTQFQEDSRFGDLPPLAQRVMRFAAQNGSISTREAFLDLDTGQASFTKRVTQIERAGYHVERVRRTHPVTGRQYTRYYFYDSSPQEAAV